MKTICENVEANVSKVLVEWESLVREQPWYSLPAGHRINNLPDVIVGLVEASLCSPSDVKRHWTMVDIAADHGADRRMKRIPEHIILTEYHLLRQAIWNYLERQFGVCDRVVTAIMHIDMAITLATTASLWGYHRSELEALGKWQEEMERVVSSSPLLHAARAAS